MNAMEPAQGPLGFSEQEMRFVLAEAIKNSSVPVDKILLVLNEANIQQLPWHHMLLPHGRTVQSCADAFEAFRSNPRPFQHHALPNPPLPGVKRKPPPDSLDPSSAGPAPKRRTSGADSMIARDILPKPPSNHGSPSGFNPSRATTAPKKRGRPSKADVEQRQAEAIARGEVIPPKTLTPKPEKQGGGESVGGFPTIAPRISPGPAPERPPQASFESRPYGSPVEDSPAKKKRARPGSRPAKAPKPGESSFSALGPEPSHAELGDALQATIPRDSVPMSEPGGSGTFGAGSHPAQGLAPVSSAEGKSSL